MALLNRLSPFSAFRNGSSFSLTSRLRKFSSLASHSHIWRKGNNVLWIDLTTVEYGLGEVVRYPDATPTEKNSRNMMKEVQNFVKEDMKKAPSERIDSVLWYTDNELQPTARMWKALDGLSPKHLELFSSDDHPNCLIKPLNTLKNQWNDLESLTLHNFNDDLSTNLTPKIFSQITSLTLDHCVDIMHFPPGLTRLKHLRALENGCSDAFCYGVDSIPNFVEVLEVLEIESTNGCDFMMDIYDSQVFKECLRKCVNLREFRLAADCENDLDTELASFIPPSVEKLTLHYTRSLPFLHHFHDWIKHSSDQSWLPQLKSFQLTVDPESLVRGKGEAKFRRDLVNPPLLSPQAFDVEFEEKRRVLYDVLKLLRPSVDLLI